VTFAIDLTGKTILVCGVHKGGMGGATCRNIVRAGGAVIALDWNQDYVDGIAAELRAMGGTVHTIVADLTDAARCDTLIAEITQKFGPINGLVNVAGGTRAEEWMPLEDTPGESLAKTMQLNFAYAFQLARDAAAIWIREGRPGAIVSVGSVSAKDSAPWHGPYGAAKSALIALTRTMANEWHQFGIRANTVSPGAVMSERVLTKSDAMSQAAKLSRDPAVGIIVSEPEQLANAITFLLCDLASGISGQNLTVDRTLSTRFCGGGRRTRKEIDELLAQGAQA